MVWSKPLESCLPLNKYLKVYASTLKQKSPTDKWLRILGSSNEISNLDLIKDVDKIVNLLDGLNIQKFMI
jgi:hypothetical protein